MADPFSYEELYKAAIQCRKSVGWKEGVTLWMDNIHSNVLKLYTEIENGEYYITPPNIFKISDPKPRTISATQFRDRVVHRSICNNGGYQALTKSLIYDNCACQIGKGIDFAIKRTKVHMWRYFLENHTNEGYVIRLDIRKYFSSIPHKLLKEMINDYINNEKMKNIMYMVVDDSMRGMKSNDELSFLDESNFDGDFGDRGLGLGSQLNQLFALLYLSPLDHYVKEKLHIKYYLRYMDDIIIFVRTKEEAQLIFKNIEEFVAKYGLVLNPKSHIFRLDQPFVFLKIKFRLTNTGKQLHSVVRSTLNREIKRIHKLVNRFKNNEITFFTLRQHLNTWHGFTKRRCNHNQLSLIKRTLRDAFVGFEKIPISV